MTFNKPVCMKKIFFLIQLAALLILYSVAAYASGGHGKGHRKHHHSSHRAEGRYDQSPRYYPNSHDRRSSQGLVGGVAGGALGYHQGKGDPLATGIGAAAGSYLGNEIAGRR
ncbi:MAG: glycine zipper 2TM domain-containing protein [Gammaproteobacteria bacterium]